MAVAGVQHRAEGVADDPPLLTIDAVPGENLTRRVRALPVFSSPFDDDPFYAAWFEGLRRALFQESCRHAVIVAEPGVGTLSVITEFARQAAADPRNYWRTRQVLWTEWQHIPADEIGALLHLLFQLLEERTEAVACVDGLLSAIPDTWWAAIRPRLLAYLDRTPARIVLIATPAEYEDLVAGHPKFKERLDRIDLLEPCVEVAKRLVQHQATALQARYGVTIDAGAVEQAVLLSHAFIPHARLPAKATKVIQRVCDDKRFDREQGRTTEARATGEDVVRQIAQVSGVPEATIRGTGSILNYHDSLQEFIKGQAHAVQEISTEMRLIQAGLTDAGRPASVMLFAGQTGTGKTEMAKALARLYSTTGRLMTYTLGNFSEPHSVSGIIGVPAGYVGHDRGGRLINELLADPYGVFLFDEADKAHPDVLQPLLNLFDEGWIVDQRGIKARADRAIFILTTNVGQRQIGDMFRESKPLTEITSRVKEMLSQIRHMKSNRPVFSPEFLARIRRVIVFGSLGESAMHEIADRLIRDLQSDWRHRRQKDLAVAEELIQALGREAHNLNEQMHGREGGRIVRKLIADSVETAILDAIGQDTAGYQACRVVSVHRALQDGATPLRQACRVQFLPPTQEPVAPVATTGDALPTPLG
jgi:ATP-dependent Clp protease ATP-binding subunit ClpA